MHSISIFITIINFKLNSINYFKHALIDQKTADIFYNEVKLPIFILNIVQYTLLGLGSLFVTVTIVKVFYNKYKKQNDYDIIETPDINGDKETTPLIID